MTDLRDRIAALSPDQRAQLESRVAAMRPGDLPGGVADADRIQPRDRSCPTPLSYAQQREWALERYRPSNNISGAVQLEGEIDLDLLSRVLTEVMSRHEVLRSTVEIVEGKPVQVVHPATPIPVDVVDLSHLDEDEQRQEVRRRYDAEVMRPFPPEQPQRMRGTALRLGPEKYVALLTTHHASSDGWSMAIVQREVATLYPALREGRDSPLSPLPIQYADYAVWQRERLGEERMQSELGYWKTVLADIPPRLELPTDRPYPVRRSFAGAHETVVFDRDATHRLHQFAEHEGVSVSMILLAASSVALHRYTEQSDLVFGSAISGRVRTETEQLVGCFANALPLRMRVSRAETLREVLRRSRDVVSAAFDHQDIPFDRLIEELAPKETSSTPLIQMMINVLTAPGALLRLSDQALEMGGLRISPLAMDPGPVPIDIIVNVQARPESVHLQWHYSTELFDATTIRDLADQVAHVVEAMVAAPDRRIGDLELLDTEARTRATPADPGVTATSVVELFRQQLAVSPDSAAIVWDGNEISFAEVDRRSDELARRLRKVGVTTETRVGILLDRSPQLPIAILGVLKAGGAFVALDTAHPSERIAYMLSDAAAPLVITTDTLALLVDDVRDTEAVLIDEDGMLPSVTDCPDLPAAPAPTSAAYICYTSGSTGLPKGVLVEHRSLGTFAKEVSARLQLGAGDRFLQFASPSFDVFVEELFPIWSAGGAVVIPPLQSTGPANDLEAIAERARVTVVELPAAYWHEWVRELDRSGRKPPSTLRLVIVGAERVLPERLATWQRWGVPLIHVYGITETTVSSTFFRLPRDPQRADLHHLPIGTALPSTGLQILDSELRPVPTGGVGELYISGIGVARGYLGRPGITAERFVADPHSAQPGTRAYRTGDLVRRRADGNLEFISRVDSQIKIRGFRVEPSEIESALCRHPQVAQAVVTVHEPRAADRRLVAYIVPPARTRPNVTDLRRFLSRELPHYLVPAMYIPLPTLPLTPNGKVDHTALPEPTDERPELVEDEFVPPSTPLERQLADIVADVLGVTQVGANDNFFELGGDSILAIQVVARAQESGIKLAPLDLFEHPTVGLLAQAAASPAPADDTEQAGMSPPTTDNRQAAEISVEEATDQEEPAVPMPATPDDFPLARVDQAQLDTLLGRITSDADR